MTPDSIEAWPEIPLEAWRDTCDTLHRYVQIAGKVRLALSPPEPEWAHVAMYVTPRGLWTGPIPYEDRSFSIEFDFVDLKADPRRIIITLRSVIDRTHDALAIRILFGDCFADVGGKSGNAASAREMIPNEGYLLNLASIFHERRSP